MPRKIARLLIVGASVRASVFSAIKGGYQVDAFDFFADWDTRKSLTTSDSLRRISEFEEIAEISGWYRCDAAVIGGGFENRVALVAKLENRIQVLGTSAANLQRLADVPHVFGVLREFGIQSPESKTSLGEQDVPENWLCKDAMSAGGASVQWASGCITNRMGGGHYYQEHKSGVNLSAVIVATETEVWMIGASRQLVGDSDWGASEFQYYGSVSFKLPEKRIVEVEKIAKVLAQQFGLRGIFGIDFIHDQDGLWPIEINPRVTASMELFESMFNPADEIQSLVDLHVKACQCKVFSQWFSEAGIRRDRRELVESKVVLFNRFRHPIRISKEIARKLQSLTNFNFYQSCCIGNTLADLPLTGELILPGHPILTLRCRMTDHLAAENWNKGMSEGLYSLLSGSLSSQ